MLLHTSAAVSGYRTRPEIFLPQGWLSGVGPSFVAPSLIACVCIEVKPGKPITHYCEKARGRLRISQATLGIGEATKKTVVQCNVGNRSPMLLCVLLPTRTESCNLDLEFEEADDVVFSVIGPRSVYLTGYYVQRIRQSDPHSDTESYGVDIEHTQTEGSSYGSDDDKYDNSFIDGDGFRKDEAIPENDKRSKRAVKTAVSDDGEKITQLTVETKADGACGMEPKQKVDDLDINGKLEGVTKLPLTEEGAEVGNEKNELPKEVETLEEIIVSNAKVLIGDTIHANNAIDTVINQSLPMSNEKYQMQSFDLSVQNRKRKRKERSMKEGKTCNAQTDNEDRRVLEDDKNMRLRPPLICKEVMVLNLLMMVCSVMHLYAHVVAQLSASLASLINYFDEFSFMITCSSREIDANYLATPPELGSVDGQKSKKRRNELQLEGTLIEGIDEICRSILKDDKFEQGLLHADSLTRDLPSANGEYQEQQRLEEICSEKIGTEHHDTPEEDKSVQVLLHADSTKENLPAENGVSQEQQIDNNININPELLATDSQLKKKTKKKKKTQGERDLNMSMTNMTHSQETTPMEHEDQTTNAAPILKRTLSNGLIIEELASGPPGGKVAVPGKKVKFYYTGMLKESGHVFDSDFAKTAFQFRLGDEEFIDGWNVGIDGMRVGDKRRLIIPPSMGFGDDGMGENVPPNSWLVYDVELVGVRK
ncbi:hypothetical protein DH2020_002333 [Rehmannia glutinosa]|uniref:peptidylprolyl isomerase n=1 Tax=Rehmannia glutinosa TaxID=99300 RepID=A0ABR0XTD9_REHGL